MAEGVQESRRQDGKRIVACACGQRYRVPIQAVGTRSCTKCDRPVSLAPTPDGAAEHAGEKLKVFVSYSRKDKDFVLWFSDALQAQDVNVFRDLDDILPTEEWWPRIEKLIAAADTVVFVISPDSVGSEICAREIAVCEKLNKRIAPIVLRDVAGHLLPGSLAKLNQVFFTARHEFDQALATLAGALQLDIGWIREHTRIGELAMRWDSRGRTGGMLEGEELKEAEAWLARRPKTAPPLTELQRAFIERSRQAASDRAKSDSDVILGLNLYAQKNYPAARDAWTRAANLGNPAAMTHLAKMLGDGVGGAANPQEALGLFSKAAALGDLEAMTFLGFLHESGDLGKTDIDQALQWYRRAAAAGQLQAMANLSGLLVRMGDEKDAAEAWRWLTYAAEHGYPVAMNGMGELALAGRWCTQDDREAERWFCKAVDHGNANAMVNLGSMHERGAGGATAAAQLYRRAADLGNADAMVKLGALSLRGAGVDQDFSEATRLFVKAAELGHAGARRSSRRGAAAWMVCKCRCPRAISTSSPARNAIRGSANPTPSGPWKAILNCRSTRSRRRSHAPIATASSVPTNCSGGNTTRRSPRVDMASGSCAGPSCWRSSPIIFRTEA